MTVSPSVHEVTKLHWPFSRDPYVLIEGKYGGYDRQEKVDPFPCYSHDYFILTVCLSKLAAKFPVKNPVQIHNLRFEALSRTNGWAEHRGIFDDENEYDWESTIVLNGKRTPIHPAMTRYMVGHEYGHQAEYELSRLRGAEPDSEETLREYKEIRPSQLDEYGAHTWHTNTKEIFANDFRILVAQLEPEFWPHDIPHPRDCKPVQEWWEYNLKVTKEQNEDRSIPAGA